MLFELPEDDILFPDPELAEPDGLLALGGDLHPDRILSAYLQGIFPWYGDDGPILWWSPDPRMVLFPDEFRYSRSLRRVVRSGKYEVRVDTAFREVMAACRDVRKEEGTWIDDDMLEAYCRLHELGFAHAFETYYQGCLVGGLYGLSVGGYFAGESMFHTITDASKVAFVSLVAFCKEHHIGLIDAQQETPHLASLGARPISRKDFLRLISADDMPASLKNTLRGKWCGWKCHEEGRG